MVWGQYLSKVLEHICLTFWVQFTEIKWPSPVDILHLQHLLMLRDLRHSAPCKVWPKLCCTGVGRNTRKSLLQFQSCTEIKYLRQVSILTS